MNFKELVLANKQNVKNIIRLITKQENEDLEQEVYIKAWKNSHKYEERGNFKSWIGTIAKNVSKDYLKSAGFRNASNTTSDELVMATIKDNKQTPEKKVLAGEFGQTIKPFDAEVQKKCIGDVTPITCRPADLIEPQLAKYEKEIEQWKEQDEDVLSYALFPQVATEFFKYRAAQKTKVDAAVADTENKAYPV